MFIYKHFKTSFPGPEYGTTEAAWKAVLNEADRRSEAHVRVRDNLNNEVITSIKNWQKDNFHKQVGRFLESFDRTFLILFSVNANKREERAGGAI